MTVSLFLIIPRFSKIFAENAHFDAVVGVTLLNFAVVVGVRK